MTDAGPEILGAELPEGTRFIGAPGAEPGWLLGRAAPAAADLNGCVACGLCLPHCPTYRLTGEESASPRGRIAAMRAVQDGAATLDPTFGGFMDLCLVCRACEDVCPSHVPFGRMMEAAREQIEPLRSRRARFVRWLGFHWALPHPSLVRTAAALQPLARPFLPRSARRLLPRSGHPFARLPTLSEPPAAVEVRGTVAMLSGCVQDRWFHRVNLATIRVLTANGWRVRVPRSQACCGALAAHNGRLAVARRLASRARHAFGDADVVVVNAAGCSAHMKTYAELRPGTELPIHDLMEFLDEHPPTAPLGPVAETVAYHDACHALRAQGIAAQPRMLLGRIPDLRLVAIPDGDRCCGAAGIYNVTEPEASDELGGAKAAAIATTGATIVASANPGCSMQLAAHLADREGSSIAVVHPVELLDRATQAGRTLTSSAGSR
ncbi:MAG TPA: (Fe-S)-binding protein [Actinomycetota bacterium]|nr:(Fe-S)-binding protein [Actinomycetota bacterium]